MIEEEREKPRPPNRDFDLESIFLGLVLGIILSILIFLFSGKTRTPYVELRRIGRKKI